VYSKLQFYSVFCVNEASALTHREGYSFGMFENRGLGRYMGPGEGKRVYYEEKGNCTGIMGSSFMLISKFQLFD
jgi:hypothetical protein